MTGKNTFFLKSSLTRYFIGTNFFPPSPFFYPNPLIQEFNSVIFICIGVNLYELIRIYIMENLNIPEYEIEGILQTLKETGLKGIMKYSDILIINHLIERGFIPENRDGIIKTLKENTDLEYGDIMTLINKYEDWKKYLPSYSLRLNLNMDSINKKYNSVIPFKYVGNSPNKRLIGFVDEGKDISVYDGIGKHLMLLGKVDKKSWSITWGTHSVLQQNHSSYITSSVRELKNRRWL